MLAHHDAAAQQHAIRGSPHHGLHKKSGVIRGCKRAGQCCYDEPEPSHPQLHPCVHASQSSIQSSTTHHAIHSLLQRPCTQRPLVLNASPCALWKLPPEGAVSQCFAVNVFSKYSICILHSQNTCACVTSAACTQRMQFPNALLLKNLCLHNYQWQPSRTLRVDNGELCLGLSHSPLVCILKQQRATRRIRNMGSLWCPVSCRHLRMGAWGMHGCIGARVSNNGWDLTGAVTVSSVADCRCAGTSGTLHPQQPVQGA